MSEIPIGSQPDPSGDEVAAWGDGGRPSLWRETGFGPALGGLIVAFLGAQQNSGVSILTAFGTEGPAFYRVLTGALPVVMGAVGAGLGFWTLRGHREGLARAIGAAAVVVGALTMVTGGLSWWGQQISHNAQCEQYGSAYSSSSDDGSGVTVSAQPGC